MCVYVLSHEKKHEERPGVIEVVTGEGTCVVIAYH
jgi:hypothetical protein